MIHPLFFLVVTFFPADNKILKGVEKAVVEDGLKTVFTLRLAPVVPIPIGAYAYIYGITALPAWEFFVGTLLGALKPYLLDSYLGSFGKDLVVGGTDGSNDTIVIGVLAVTTLVGVFATQVATRMWEKVYEEVSGAEEDDSEGGEEETDDGIVSRTKSFFLSFEPVSDFAGDVGNIMRRLELY